MASLGSLPAAKPDPAATARVLPLEAIEPDDLPRVGAKAATLAALHRDGFAVPDGFVVTTAARAESGGLPEDELAAEILAAAASLGDGPLAVRSSAVAEDRPEASYAGLYESVLHVRGPEALLAAVGRVWASAEADRVRGYAAEADAASAAESSPAPGIAVLVQPMVAADAAGVAFSADPITGDRDAVVVNAVRGLGDRLVGGEVTPDEWEVRAGQTILRQGGDRAIDPVLASAVADVARRLERRFGVPQDVEWAAVGHEVVVLQARPMTALPDAVDWDPGQPGGWLRNFRLGEWLGDPVSPLFESWAITGIERRLDDLYASWFGMRPPEPTHVVVNGWYFYGFNVIPSQPARMIAVFVRHMLPSLILRPRRAVMAFPQLARFGIGLAHREWREEIQPAYRTAVRTAEEEVERADFRRLVAIVDGLVEAAGTYFTSMTLVGGYAAKAEFPLARFYRAELQPRIGGSFLDLLAGLGDGPSERAEHAVHSLDWVDEPPSDAHPTAPATNGRHAEAAGARRVAEERARAALAADPKLLARFERLLDEAQRFGLLREEQAREFTLPWPVLRRAVLRLGEALVLAGTIAEPDQVFYLTRSEVVDALGGSAGNQAIRAAERRELRDRQRRLSPPLTLGTLSPMLVRLLDQITAAIREPVDDPGALVGIPASAGRASGPVRVVRSREAFDTVRPGDVLVASMTTPAWTPLFGRISAVVTDNGGVGAHASIVAREYGIPAVVGLGDATRRLRDGEIVEVDGSRGVVRRL